MVVLQRTYFDQCHQNPRHQTGPGLPGTGLWRTEETYSCHCIKAQTQLFDYSIQRKADFSAQHSRSSVTISHPDTKARLLYPQCTEALGLFVWTAELSSFSRKHTTADKRTCVDYQTHAWVVLSRGRKPASKYDRKLTRERMRIIFTLLCMTDKTPMEKKKKPFSLTHAEIPR